MLDMSARSVQIWLPFLIPNIIWLFLMRQTRFQKKRQSMRQTTRQSSTVGSSSHHPFSMTNPVDPMADDLMPHPSSAYDTSSGPLAESMYPSQDAVTRSYASHSHSQHHHQSSHRHHRDQEVINHRKWSRALWEEQYCSPLTYSSSYTRSIGSYILMLTLIEGLHV
jgi:homeobox protein YOX1/YHP1